MIGIGVTHTSNRPKHLKLFLSQIKKHTKQPYKLHIATDIMNIAKAKNDCLWNLKECEHIFLYDNDTFPIQDGWVEFFIQRTNYALYLNDRHNLSATLNGMNLYKDCGGCFIYIDKEKFNEVGYFNSEYKQYGFEHAGFSQRHFKGFYPCIPNTTE